ncbi:thioredoxin family protein [Synechococcus sp. RSCCF101]|uniref:thioredoxin family protein n=1 Tax=Synechococcus sp. RSCCF101 TaxID=2511069 RepID=UPI0012484F25|nr:thioredoxin family protein [Synechococcus sp. RSCCF101]QEY32304.1 thioredoxin family protein [Synechococcus sp. RSCCF101]
MVLTHSTMLPLGSPLPELDLERIDGGRLRGGDLAGRPLLVLFLCAHCPYVRHVEPELSRLEREYGSRVQLLAIASNSLITHPQDGPDQLREQARSNGWRFPYLLDPDQTAARAFRAACTPDPFLFDADHRLVYRGQLDGSRPGSDVPLDGRDLRAALEALLAGSPPLEPQIAAMGCNIKWHPGQEPDWFG